MGASGNRSGRENEENRKRQIGNDEWNADKL